MDNKIPFLDLKRQYASIQDEVLTAVRKVFEQTAFSAGPFAECFEKEFAAYCGAKHCVGVNSGTSALHLALLALGVGAGDEVIVPADTFIATAWAASYVGATPVFVDCDQRTWNIDVGKIEAVITKRTRAIIGVHLYGQPFDVDAVALIAKKHQVYLVEDCAQAQGATYKSIRVGTFGDIGCFSFYPGKNLGAYGEAGAIVTNVDRYAEHVASLKNHGQRQRYYHDFVGFNMRMDGLQGAILSIKLRYLDGWNSRRKAIARLYQQRITNKAITTQYQPSWSDSIYHLFVVTTPDREALVKHLQGHNIFPGLHYPVPCHLQKAYAHLGYQEGDLPNAEYLAKHCVSLPMFPEMTDGEVQRVIDVVNSYH